MCWGPRSNQMCQLYIRNLPRHSTRFSVAHKAMTRMVILRSHITLSKFPPSPRVAYQLHFSQQAEFCEAHDIFGRGTLQ